MRVATAVIDGQTTAVLSDHRGWVRADAVLESTHPDAWSVVQSTTPAHLDTVANSIPDGAFSRLEELAWDAPTRQPRMIWGIGLNYVDHASDLDATAPAQSPASFIKADHTIIGPGEPIRVPWQSQRTTSEAELGIVIGKTCSNVSEAEALGYVWGYVPVLDQTAEDILQQNPRYLTRSKNFPGFFSFGPHVVTATEVHKAFNDIGDIEVRTILNGQVHRANRVSNMTFSPQKLISFHSEMMTLRPGDIISSGTPGAAVISGGDIVTCHIPGIGELSNPVETLAVPEASAVG